MVAKSVAVKRMERIYIDMKRRIKTKIYWWATCVWDWNIPVLQELAQVVRDWARDDMIY